MRKMLTIGALVVVIVSSFVAGATLERERHPSVINVPVANGYYPLITNERGVVIDSGPHARGPLRVEFYVSPSESNKWMHESPEPLRHDMAASPGRDTGVPFYAALGVRDDDNRLTRGTNGDYALISLDKDGYVRARCMPEGR